MRRVAALDDPFVMVGAVCTHLSGAHSVAVVTLAVDWKGSVTTLTSSVSRRLGDALMRAATGAADVPAPVLVADLLLNDETLGCVSFGLPQTGGGQRDDDPVEAVVVLLLVRGRDGRWFASAIGDPPICRDRERCALSCANALRWVEAPAGCQRELDELLVSAMETVDDLM